VLRCCAEELRVGLYTNRLSECRHRFTACLVIVFRGELVEAPQGRGGEANRDLRAAVLRRDRKASVAAVLVPIDGHAGVFELLHKAAEVTPRHPEPIGKGLPSKRLFGRLQGAAEPAGGLGERFAA
jgi:hypothetical protein